MIGKPAPNCIEKIEVETLASACLELLTSTSASIQPR